MSNSGENAFPFPLGGVEDKKMQVTAVIDS